MPLKNVQDVVFTFHNAACVSDRAMSKVASNRALDIQHVMRTPRVHSIEIASLA